MNATNQIIIAPDTCRTIVGTKAHSLAKRTPFKILLAHRFEQPFQVWAQLRGGDWIMVAGQSTEAGAMNYMQPDRVLVIDNRPTLEQLDPDAADIPEGAQEIPTICHLERRRFHCKNGSKFVLLHDESEEGWEAYCEYTRKSTMPRTLKMRGLAWENRNEPESSLA